MYGCDRRSRLLAENKGLHGFPEFDIVHLIFLAAAGAFDRGH